MLEQHTNPLISEQMLSQTSHITATEHKGQKNLEASNALSQLLDSAMFNAAKESSPEFDSKASSNPNSTVTSPKSVKFNRFEFTCNKKNEVNIYTIEELLALKSTATDCVNDKIPPKEFWCLHKGPYQKKEFNNFRGKKHNKKDFEQRRRKPEISDFFADGGGDSESKGDNIIDDQLKMEMGETVEDFERWRQSQHRKNNPAPGMFDEPVQQPSNDVDNFFSFVRSPNTEEKKHLDTSSQSSRFSSFFTPSDTQKDEKPSEKSSRFFGGAPVSSNPTITTSANANPNHPIQSLPQLQPQSQQVQNQNNEKETTTLSTTPQFQKVPLDQQPADNLHRRISNPGMNMGHSIPQGQQQPVQQLPQQISTGQSQIPGHQRQTFQHVPQTMQQGPNPMAFPPGLPIPNGFPGVQVPGNNDSFFMSLMSKRPEDNKSGQNPNNGSQQQQQQQQQHTKPANNQLPPWMNKLNGQAPPSNVFPSPIQQQGQVPRQGQPLPQQVPPQQVPPQQDKNGRIYGYPPPPPGMFPGNFPPGMYPQYDPNVMRNMPPPGIHPPATGAAGHQQHPQHHQMPPGLNGQYLTGPPGIPNPNQAQSK